MFQQNSLEKWDMLGEACSVLKEIEEQLKECSGVARKTMADKVNIYDSNH
jgi:hypothetical protein